MYFFYIFFFENFKISCTKIYGKVYREEFIPNPSTYPNLIPLVKIRIIVEIELTLKLFYKKKVLKNFDALYC